MPDKRTKRERHKEKVGARKEIDGKKKLDIMRYRDRELCVCVCVCEVVRELVRDRTHTAQHVRNQVLSLSVCKWHTVTNQVHSSMLLSPHADVATEIK